jgi:hypothetical protein
MTYHDNNDDTSSSSLVQQVPPPPDLYAVLRLDRTATTLEITQAFRLLARTFHPDKNKNNFLPTSTSNTTKQDAEQNFVLIKQAHDVLMDRVLRFVYDHGGLTAVDIVKRSHSARTHRQQENENDDTNIDNDDSDDEDDDDEDNKQDDFYEQIRRAKSKKAAVQIVRRLSRAHAQHQVMQQQQKQQTPSAIQTNVTTNHHFTNKYLAAEDASLQMHSTHTLTPQIDMTVQCTSNVARTATASVQTQLGVGYRPKDGVTVWHVMMGESPTRISNYYHQQQQQQQQRKVRTPGTSSSSWRSMIPFPSSSTSMSLQTTRRLYDKSLVTVGLGGLMTKTQTWACTIATSRIILVGSLLGGTGGSSSSTKHSKGGSSSTSNTIRIPTKLHASFRSTFRLMKGELQGLMVQLRTLHFPQWKLRLGLGGASSSDIGSTTPLIKVSYTHSAEHAWHMTWAWHWIWWRIKVTKEDPLLLLFGGSSSPQNDDSDYEDDEISQCWNIRYGFKYDTRTALLFGQPWTLLLHVHHHSNVNDWSFHIPIDIIHGNEWPIQTVLAFLGGRWLEHAWDKYMMRKMMENSQEGTVSSLRTNGTSEVRVSHFRDIIVRVAESKRRQEELKSPKGLIFLMAYWQDHFGPTQSSSSSTYNKQKSNDVKDLLQYWTTQGQVCVDHRRIRWDAPWILLPFLQGEEEEEEEVSVFGRLVSATWWKKRWQLVRHFWKRNNNNDDDDNDNANGPSSLNDDVLYVRYQYHNIVYEVELSSSNSETEFVFPHARATVMGDASVVQ